MANYIGTFYGFVNYDEITPVASRSRDYSTNVKPFFVEIFLLDTERHKLNLIDELNRSAYDYQVITGFATDVYVEYPIRQASYFVWLLCWDLVDVQYVMIDGSAVTLNYNAENSGALEQIHIIAFRVKNTVPGANSRFQFTAYY